MIIKSRTKNYEATIHDNLDFINELKNVKNSFFVIDSNVYRIYNEHFKNIEASKLMVFTAIEENKTIDSALNICERIVEMAAKRNTTLISIGGGIVQDVTGFVANILYRGIKWIFVPTTLLASSDSCIGGKTSLNYKHYKNLLGTFYPPDSIHLCPLFFNTLTKKDFNSGLGEVVKFALMKKEKSIKELEQDYHKLVLNDTNTTIKYLNLSLNYKREIIEEDEFDKGRRITLNFGHTFGHALESVSSYNIPHGTGVAIGIMIANYISYKRNYLSESLYNKMNELLMPIIKDINFDYISFNQDLSAAMKKDKKQVDDRYTALLFDNNLDVQLISGLDEKEISEAFTKVQNLLKQNQ